MGLDKKCKFPKILTKLEGLYLHSNTIMYVYAYKYSPKDLCIFGLQVKCLLLTDTLLTHFTVFDRMGQSWSRILKIHQSLL